MLTQKQLEDKITKAQAEYYVGTSSISDAEFDALWDELKDRFPTSEVLTKIGSDLVEGDFEKCQHSLIAGSQSKANTAEEMTEFFHKNGTSKRYLYQYKCDGSSVILKYVNGNLVRAASRGDGKEGIVYTDNVKKMGGVPRKIDSSFTGEVRGEVLLFKANKDAYFPDAPNCRNMATGIFHRLDGVDCDKLDVVCYDAQFEDKSKAFETQVDLMSWLNTNGFNVAKWNVVDNPTGNFAKNTIDKLFNDLSEVPYDIDGIVWKQNDIDMTDITSNYRPTTQIALKPARFEAKTILREIEWNMTNEVLCPIAIFDPIFLEGSTVQRASLSNVANLEKLNLDIGDEIVVVKAGMIIPQVIRVSRKFNEM